MSERFSLKDQLFNENKVRYLASLLTEADKNFDAKSFVKEIIKEFPQLELKQRISHITDTLEKYLPRDYEAAVAVILKSLPPPLDPTQTDDDFGDFIFAPFGEYIVRNGLSKKYLALSFRALREITMRFSMEDSMRSFLNTFPEETLRVYDKWVSDKNYHVRRLVSESTRPTLPWAKRLSLDYHVPLRYLDVLYTDKTRFATRSVANHLNDISKKDAALVVETLKRWQKEDRQREAELAWITKHALRTLVKKGDREALKLLGYESDIQIRVREFIVSSINPLITRGDVITLTSELETSDDCVVLVDYVLHMVKANGQTKPKVFKWTKLALKKGESISLKKRHHLKADATTFTLYAGEYQLALQINGKILDKISFRVH